MSRKAKKEVALAIPAPTKKPWELSADEVELVKNHIAKGASDSELAFCLGVARRFKLDPFRGQIWFVRRRDKNLDRYDKIEKKKITGYRWIPIVGINGLLHIAARDHKKAFGSIGQVEYGPAIEIEWNEWGWEGEKPVHKGKRKLLVPGWAKVEVHKRGDLIATVGEVYWEEIYPNVDNAPLVRQMPKLMLGKCAKAQAIRAAYPATDGLYIQEEFMVEQLEPSENATRSLDKVQAVDAKIAQFKLVSGGKPPTEEQLSFLEQGETAEEVLLKQTLSESQVQEIWPKSEKPSVEDQAG